MWAVALRAIGLTPSPVQAAVQMPHAAHSPLPAPPAMPTAVPPSSAGSSVQGCSGAAPGDVGRPMRRRGPPSSGGRSSPCMHGTPPSLSERRREARDSPGSASPVVAAVSDRRAGPTPPHRPAGEGSARGKALTTLLLLSGATAGAVHAEAIELHPALKAHQSARAQAMFAVLRSDSTSQAINASDERMLEMCELAIDALDSDGGELRGNAKSDWKHWIGFCSWAGILPWRTNAAAALGTDTDARLREQVIWINALLYIWPRMRNAPGRALPPKPTSALQILKGIRRMHTKLGYETVPLTPVVRAMKTLLEKYRDKHGPEALQPHRKEPLTNELIIALFAAVRADDNLSEQDRRAWLGMWHLLAQTGMRKAEVALPAGESFGLKHFSWDNIKWQVGGRTYAALTPALYRQLSEGDIMIIRPPPSKADPFGLRWGVRPIYLPYSATAPICAARAIAELELHAQPRARQHEQPFAMAAGLLRKATVDEHFKQWMRLPYVAGGEAHRYSVHSFRSYLATALAEQGASTARIQAMLRWASDDAVNIYNRTTEGEYCGWVRAAASAEIETIMTHHLPRAEAARDGTRAREIVYEADGMIGELLEARELNALFAEAEAADA